MATCGRNIGARHYGQSLTAREHAMRDYDYVIVGSGFGRLSVRAQLDSERDCSDSEIWNRAPLPTHSKRTAPLGPFCFS
jgi:hypothetical protein